MASVISIENLSKAYHLGQIGTGTFAHDLNAWWAKLHGKPNPLQKIGEADHGNRDGKTIWALKDISFTVKQGEVLGIIGRNGAGKSTLLKILSRVTAPTSGRIRVKGRVASLLEVGTGFHPELTGRENIYLNGAILGMSHREIERKFDEIVSFADIEKFIDTPVKRYSSGMYVRLAFAVAAHLEPEILVVDEVLAVGDAEFQKKCLGKIGEVAKEGRTVLFVSHNMAAIQNLCSSSLWLSHGGVCHDIAPSDIVVEKYLNYQKNDSLDDFSQRPTWAQPLITTVRILSREGREKTNFLLGEEINIEMKFEAKKNFPLKAPVMGVVLNSLSKGCVGGVNTRMTGFNPQGQYTSGKYYCTLTDLNLLTGMYSVDVWLGDGLSDLDTLAGSAVITIENTDVYSTGKPPFAHMGIIFLKPKWDLDEN